MWPIKWKQRNRKSFLDRSISSSRFLIDYERNGPPNDFPFLLVLLFLDWPNLLYKLASNRKGDKEERMLGVIKLAASSRREQVARTPSIKELPFLFLSFPWPTQYH